MLVVLVCVLMNVSLPTDPGSEAIVEIREVLNLQVAAWNRGDITAYMDGYWNSDSLVFTSGGAVSRGWQSTFKKYNRKYDSVEKMGTLSFTGVEVTLLSNGSAWVLGKWSLVRSVDQPHGMFTLVLRKFPDGWKIIHDHTSLATG